MGYGVMAASLAPRNTTKVITRAQVLTRTDKRIWGSGELLPVDEESGGGSWNGGMVRPLLLAHPSCFVWLALNSA